MTLQEIKQLFFSFRNGVVAKAFYDAGAPYKTIFGLQIPQLAEIARQVGFDSILASQLWADCGCRESRLLACRLFNPETLGKDEALRLACTVQTREEADYLAFVLLRRLPFGNELVELLGNGSEMSPMRQYMSVALKRNLE